MLERSGPRLVWSGATGGRIADQTAGAGVTGWAGVACAVPGGERASRPVGEREVAERQVKGIAASTGGSIGVAAVVGEMPTPASITGVVPLFVAATACPSSLVIAAIADHEHDPEPHRRSPPAARIVACRGRSVAKERWSRSTASPRAMVRSAHRPPAPWSPAADPRTPRSSPLGANADRLQALDRLLHVAERRSLCRLLREHRAQESVEHRWHLRPDRCAAMAFALEMCRAINSTTVLRSNGTRPRTSSYATQPSE